MEREGGGGGELSRPIDLLISPHVFITSRCITLRDGLSSRRRRQIKRLVLEGTKRKLVKITARKRITSTPALVVLLGDCCVCLIGFLLPFGL